MPAYREQDEAKKAELMKKFGTETMPNTMAILEKLLTKNGGKYFVGKNVTWADIEVANFWDGMKQHSKSELLVFILGFKSAHSSRAIR